MRIGFLNWGCAALVAAIVGITLPAEAGAFQLLSVADPAQGSSAGGSGDSWAPMISPNGRYVLFASTANDLVLTTNNPPTPISSPLKLNVFLRDRMNGTTTLVSVNLTGLGGGNGGSLPADVSANGRYAAFESSASDLAPGDTNNATDVFVRDLTSRVTRLVSVGTDGSVGNGDSRGATMTPDGRYVAFVTAATNLVPDDTNGIPDVFVRDMQGGSNILVSAGAASAGAVLSYTTSSSESPDITPDGRYVAYFSTATNLVPGVGTVGDIYVRDLVGGSTCWASSNARAALLAAQGTTNGVCYNHIISADGQFVAYEVSRAPGSSALTPGIILRYNVGSGQTDVVNTNACVLGMPYEDIHNLEMTPDGRFIAFVANTNGTSGAATCIYVWDAQAGIATLASGNLSNTVSAKSLCDKPVLSTNGQFVAFLSSATNMVTNAVVGDVHAYRRDLQAGVAVLLDTDTSGTGSPVNPETFLCLSADGRFAAFECAEGNLVPRNRSHGSDVFVRDVATGVSELVSARDTALDSLTPNGATVFSTFSLSADGRYFAFASEANNLTANDTNLYRDVFLRDLAAGTNCLVSVDTNGFSGDGLSAEPAISADGRYVAFTSSADNLVAGDTNKAADVFVRDMQAGTTVLVSLNTAGTGPGNKHSYSPVISGDGRYVLFLSKASNLASGSFSGTENLFVRDLQAGTNYALTTAGAVSPSMTPDGRFVSYIDGTALYVWDSPTRTKTFILGATGLSVAAISPDGNRIVYSATAGLYLRDRAAGTTTSIGPALSGSHPGLRFSGDSRLLVYARLVNSTNQVYLYDYQAGTSLLVSHRYGSSVEGTGVSDWPDISPDGRFVAYRSAATDLVASATNGVPAIFLYDRQSGATTLLGVSRFGNYPAGNRSLSPVFGGDSQTLVFGSWAPDQIGWDFNQSADVFAYNLYSSGAIPLFYARVIVGGTTPQQPVITWLTVPGRIYRVQFKNKLSDSVWQTMNSGITIVGSQAYCSDLVPDVVRRFYRVVAF
jgi:Tol biopolymer transport system component